MTEGTKIEINAHLDMINVYIKKLHEQVYTGIIRVEDRTSTLAIDRITAIRELIARRD